MSSSRESGTSTSNSKGAEQKNPDAMATSSQSVVEEWQSPALGARIVSGSVGSLITALAVTPLEVVKVHLQNAKPISTPSSAPVAVPENVTLCPRGCGTFVLNNGLFDCVLPKSSVPYFDQMGNLKCLTHDAKSTATMGSGNQVGTISMIRNIFLKEGFRGIYAGLGPTLVMGIPSTALYYTVYDELVAHLRKNPAIVESADTFVPLMAGASARLLSTLLTAPLELIRTRQASAVGEGKEVQGMITEFQAIVRNEGCGALYKGLAPTLWRDVPFSGIYWVCYEKFQGLFRATLVQEGDPHTSMQQASLSFLSGASSGMVAAACTTVSFLLLCMTPSCENLLLTIFTKLTI
jgi:solute carrier family 25, member 39/40